MDASTQTLAGATSTGSKAAPLGLALALLILLGIAGVAVVLHGRPDNGTALSLSWLLGAAFGFVMQRSRFCFHCNFRDFVERREPRGLLAIIAALAVGTLGYWVVHGIFLPDPSAGRLAPDAHIGPVSAALLLAGTVFGLGMAISGSCLSGHLYRLGEGSPASPFAIVGAAGGFVLGFASWPVVHEAAVLGAPVPWLPADLGYGGWLVLQLAVLALLAALLLRHLRPLDPARERHAGALALFTAPFAGRWPGWLGGIAVGVLATVAYLRVEPLGVTAELGSLARTAALDAGLIPARLDGLDTLRGCATAVHETLFTNNGMFVAALVLGALAGGVGAGQFRPSWPGGRDVARGLAGGVLLGWGAMTALGCTVGTLLSGVMAGAVSGVVFAIACAAGAWLGLRAMRRLG